MPNKRYAHEANAFKAERANILQAELQSGTNWHVLCNDPETEAKNFQTYSPNCCASGAEAEYAALYETARLLLPMRQYLTELGYPQPATLILCDNAVAVKLANDNLVEKKSKTFDMRFHWIKDRVQQGQFEVAWRKGSQNLSDIFTKLLPVSQHKRLAKHLVWYSEEQVQPAIAKRAASRNFTSSNYYESLYLDSLEEIAA